MIGRIRRLLSLAHDADDAAVAREVETEFDPGFDVEADLPPRARAGGFWRRAARERIVVYAAGPGADEAVAALRASAVHAVAGVLGEAPAGWRHRFGRLGGIERLAELCRRSGARRVVVAGGPLAPDQRRALDAALREAGATCSDMPSLADILAGRVAAAPRRFDVEDLLPRPGGELCPRAVRHSIEGGVALVTGAGGSIGSALCRLLLECAPRRLILYELSEFALYQIDQELRGMRSAGRCPPGCEIVPVLGSVCDQPRLERLIERHGVGTLYHAAAYKHVPLVEANVIEGVRNNVLGTASVVEAARRGGVARVVLVSTDKAVRPTSVMGATKRVAETIVQDAQRGGGRTVFSIVRFGNVLGSSGSVIPLFRAQIEAGGPVTVTHPEMTRYFMTIPEAASLVIQAGAMAEGGEVFLLDMGAPVRILDVARRMIELSGLQPLMPGETGRGVPIVFTGVREGEKLYEELLIDDQVLPSHHPRIARAREACPPRVALAQNLRRMSAAVAASDVAAALAALAEAATQYQPSGVHADAADRASAPFAALKGLGGGA